MLGEGAVSERDNGATRTMLPDLEEQTDRFLVVLKLVSDDERLQVMAALRQEFCTHCGRWYESPTEPPCCCWKDE